MAIFYRAFNLVNNCTLLLNARALQINQTSGIKQKVANRLKELKVPDRPKRPLSAYFKFVQDQRQALVKQHPDWNVTEITKQCSKEWKLIDPELKQQYEKAYKEELEAYSKRFLEYSEKLTEEQKSALKEYSKEVKNARTRRKYKKKMKENEKPKRPLGAYMMFIMDHVKSSGKNYGQLLAEMKGKWGELPEDEKVKYTEAAAIAKEKYEKELKEWEMKMIAQGNVDLVRYKTLLETPAGDKTKPE